MSTFAHADTLELLNCWMGQCLRHQEGYFAAGSPTDADAKRGAAGVGPSECRGRKRSKQAHGGDNGGDAGGDAA
jgi:hypothetical protein